MLDWLRQVLGAIAEGIGRGIRDGGDKLIWEGFFSRHVPETPSRSNFEVGSAIENRPEKGSLDRLLDLHPSQFDHDRGERDRDGAPGIDL